MSEQLKRIAHVVLPIGTFAETRGTYVNWRGCGRASAGAAAPVGEARPGWKVLRVLGKLLNLAGFDYQSSDEVLAEARELRGGQRERALPAAATAWRPPGMARS